MRSEQHPDPQKTPFDPYVTRGMGILPRFGNDLVDGCEQMNRVVPKSCFVGNIDVRTRVGIVRPQPATTEASMTRAKTWPLDNADPWGTRRGRRRIVRAAIAALFGLMLATAAQAQNAAVWNTIGPPGGSVTALLTSPMADAVLYAGTAENGVFVSADAGATWSADNAGLTASTVTGRQRLYTVHGLASDGRWLYAATDAGVFYTMLGTAPAWTPLPGPTTATPMTLLAFDASTSRLFAATGLTDGVAVPGIYVTAIDTSAPAPAPAWTFAALPGAAGATVDSIALVAAQVPVAPAALLAASGNKLYTASVLPASTALAWNDGDPSGDLAAGSITAVHYSGEFLRAYACSGGSAFQSGNPLDAVPVWQPSPVASTGAIPFNCRSFATVPIAAGGAPAVLLGTDEGVFVSVDGVNFLATGPLAVAPSAHAFAIAKLPGAAAGTVFVGAGFGVASVGVTSLAGGVAWTPSNGPAALAAGGAHVRLDNASIVDSAVLGTTLFAAAVGNDYDEVLASSDGGASWASTHVGGVLGANDTVISLLPDNAHATLFAATTRGLFAYSPSTAQWSPVGSTAITGRVGALALGSSALIVGTDTGAWAVPLGAAPSAAVPVAAGLSGASVRTLLVSGGNVFAVTIDATDVNVVWLATEASVVTGTAVWAAYANGPSGTDRITALVPVGGGLLASTNGSLVLFATQGSAWASANTSADPAQQISDPFGAVTGLYSDGVSIYASTGSNGVFVSPLATSFSWTAYTGSGNTALPSMEVHTLRASGSTLYAATRAGLASLSGIAVVGGGTPPPPPPPPSTDSGGGALDPWSDLFLLGAVLSMLAMRLHRRRQVRVAAEARRERR